MSFASVAFVKKEKSASDGGDHLICSLTRSRIECDGWDGMEGVENVLEGLDRIGGHDP